jgi:hypothetical protein
MKTEGNRDQIVKFVNSVSIFKICYCRLCEPEGDKSKGEPFLLKKAVPIDMFPQTNHCELVMQFVR